MVRDGGSEVAYTGMESSKDEEEADEGKGGDVGEWVLIDSIRENIQ